MNTSIASNTEQPAEQLPTTIHSLPPELLVETFQHLAEMEPIGDDIYPGDSGESDTASSLGSSSDDETSVDNDYIPDSSASSDSDASSDSLSTCPALDLGWMRVTHVCSRWRNVAINAATLWSVVPLDLCPEWVHVLIERSQDALLDIHIPSSTVHLEDIDICRIRQIICDDPDIPVLDIIAKMPKSASPPLQCLDIVGVAHPIIHLNVFKLLRRLDIRVNSADETWDALSESTHLPLLTELRLSVDERNSITLSSGHCTALLKNLIMLELNFIPCDFKGNVVELPRLRHLTIYDVGPFCGTFAQQSYTPNLRNYSVHYLEAIYPDTTDLGMVKGMGFARVFDDAGPSIAPLHTLTITHFRSFYAGDTSGNIEVHGWHCAEQMEELDFPFDDRQMAPINADISHSVAFAKSPMRQLNNFAMVLLSHPALSALRMLSLDLHPHLDLGDASSWVDLFQPMRQLRYLRISSPSNKHGSPAYILEALRCRDIDYGYVVPALEQLTLVDWDPYVGRDGRYNEPLPVSILREIALNRPRETSLKAIHIVSWRYSMGEEWYRRHLSDVHDVKIVYERLFVSLDHVHATEKQDPDSDVEESEEGNLGADNEMSVGQVDS